MNMGYFHRAEHEMCFLCSTTSGKEQRPSSKYHDSHNRKRRRDAPDDYIYVNPTLDFKDRLQRRSCSILSPTAIDLIVILRSRQKSDSRHVPTQKLKTTHEGVYRPDARASGDIDCRQPVTATSDTAANIPQRARPSSRAAAQNRHAWLTPQQVYVRNTASPLLADYRSYVYNTAYHIDNSCGTGDKVQCKHNAE